MAVGSVFSGVVSANLSTFNGSLSFGAVRMKFCTEATNESADVPDGVVNPDDPPPQADNASAATEYMSVDKVCFTEYSSLLKIKDVSLPASREGYGDIMQN